MAQTAERPRLATARRMTEVPQGLVPAVWDVDAFHAMDRRDEMLIRDELLSGAGSSAFVYNFRIQGKDVAGISVIGARHLASEYGGIKHRLVASAEKRGALFTFTSYPSEGVEMRVTCAVVPELETEPDFYRVVVEIQDIKTGNTIQVERQELRNERKTDGSFYERPNFPTIAQSKAFRNGVLAIVPQDVQIEWKQKMLALGKNIAITQSVIEEKRAGVLRFAAAKGIPLSRDAVEGLILDQITGLGDAAREGNAAAFAQSAQALGLIAGAETTVVEDGTPAKTAETKPAEQAKPAETGEQSGSEAKGPTEAEAAKTEKTAEAELRQPTEQREPTFDV